MHSRFAILAIFVLSGAAGLVYEIVWSRQLVLVFGNTTQAVSTILTGFFGGMAIGAAIGGRIADRVRSPLRMYAVLELVLVAVVLVTPLTFDLIHEAYRGVYPALEGTPWIGVVRLVLAVIAISPATILMGATFPSLMRYLTADASLSRSFGRLYAANTIGAILGTLAAGLVLIEILGLSGALAVGAAGSLVSGLAALALDRRAQRPASTAAPTPPPPRAPSGAGAVRVQLALVVAFMSGVTSLGYQVTWTRLLASGTGNTTYVFTMILATFLAGIALGALIHNLGVSRLGRPVRVLAVSQALVAVLAVLGLVFVLVQPEALTPSRPLDTLVALAASTFIVVLPVTIVLGIAFPTASALLRGEAETAGRESGSLLAVNTTGAIIGSLLIPFVLMPLIGSPWIVVMLAAGNGILAIALALADRPRSMPVVAVGLTALAIVVVMALRPGAVSQPNEALIQINGGTIFESAEDEIASVQAGQVGSTPELWVAGTSMTLLTVDAHLMPILPLMARPQAERALVVAFGMGTSFRTALVAGLQTDTVELVPSVVRMFRYYHPDAERVLADPRGRVIVADGRNHLELTTERFDIIVTDPPPPIESSGASVISSREYYETGLAHLVPGGIMMQWVPYGAPEAEFRDHVRTFAAVFPEITIIRGAGGYGVYMLGSERPIVIDDEAIRTTLARPGVLDDISSAYDSPADTVDGWVDVIRRQRWLDDGAAVRAYAGDGPLVTDDRPLPEYFLLRRTIWAGG
ncbi:MAG: fused MFS/spermidine synthase [Chloroflexota bacterium]